jgi:hypothetical protein
MFTPFWGEQQVVVAIVAAACIFLNDLASRTPANALIAKPTKAGKRVSLQGR